MYYTTTTKRRKYFALSVRVPSFERDSPPGGLPLVTPSYCKWGTRPENGKQGTTPPFCPQQSDLRYQISDVRPFPAYYTTFNRRKIPRTICASPVLSKGPPSGRPPAGYTQANGGPARRAVKQPANKSGSVVASCQLRSQSKLPYQLRFTPGAGEILRENNAANAILLPKFRGIVESVLDPQRIAR